MCLYMCVCVWICKAETKPFESERQVQAQKIDPNPEKRYYDHTYPSGHRDVVGVRAGYPYEPEVTFEHRDNTL